METGVQFIKTQLSNAEMLHQMFLQSLEDHASEADDPRYRDLCNRYFPLAREHHRELQAYQRDVGAPTATVRLARGLADAARETDYVRLVADIVLARRCTDVCDTFREAGRILGHQQLQQIGELGARQHDQFVREANRLAQWMFVERAQGISAEDAVFRTEADYRVR